MPSVCRLATDAQVGDHVTIKYQPYPECVHKSKVTQLVPLFGAPENSVCTAYTGCAVNEMVALKERHGIPLPPVDPDEIFRLGQHDLKRRPGRIIDPMTWDELIKDVPSNRRRKVEQAKIRVDEGWNDRFADVTAFIKFEKWEAFELFSELEKPMDVKAPRLIQFREPAYTYELARFLRPIEKFMFNTSADGRWVSPNKRLFSKGLTSWQIASNLVSKISRFENPVMVLLDYSRMDATLRLLLRRAVEWSYYKRCNPSWWLAKLLKLQEKNRVRAMSGLLWVIIGTMMSGEYNTSCGDSKINDAINAYLLDGVDYDQLINGDDGVLIMEWIVYQKLDLDYAKLGMTAKVDLAHCIEDVQFCQCHPVQLDAGWRMVRNPWRVMSRSSYTCKTLNGEGWMRLLGSIGLGELSCNNGVPVLQSYASMLYRSAGKRTSKALLDEYMYMRPDKIDERLMPISMRARQSFSAAFGISPTEQWAMEQVFDCTEIPCLPLGG